MITIKEIAELAGTSRGTVDRALKGRKGVSAETKARIEEICREHHYEPNRAGILLGRQRKEFRVGVVLPSLDNTLFDEVIAGLEEAEAQFADFGVRLELYELGLSAAEQAAAIGRLRENGMQALIIAPLADERLFEKLRRLREEGIFILTLGKDVAPRDANVQCPPEKLGRAAAELVCLIGRRVAVFGGCGVLPGRAETLAAFVEACAGRGQLCASDSCSVTAEETAERLRALIAKNPEVLAVDVAGLEAAVREAPAGMRLVALGTDRGTPRALERELVCLAVSDGGREQGRRAVALIVRSCIDRRQAEERSEVPVVILGRYS